MKHVRFALVLALGVTTVMFAQDIQVNRQNKTIAVTAEDSITADAEVAVLVIGYHNYAPTQEAAFQENIRASDQITKALLGAGISKSNIETEKLRLGRVEQDDKWTGNEEGSPVRGTTILAYHLTRLASTSSR
jgi:uncharacterized protein